MATSGIKVLTIGKKFDLPYEVRHVDDSAQILPAIAQFQPDVVVTSTFIPGQLSVSSFEIRKKWINVDPSTKAEDLVCAIENCYFFNLFKVHQNQAAQPLVSVYTGTFNTGNYLRETYQSLREQSYPNWEWLVVDDHSDDGTWERLVEIAKEDVRVRPVRSGKRLSKIGAVKDMATRLCKGVYLVELDHDDMLTDFALEEIKKAFEADPDVGFVYSNCSNFFENGAFHRFTDDFWKSRYRETEYRGKKWVECLNPNIEDRFGPHFTQQFGYFLTVGPNHVRAFRASTLFELGGYNPSLPVADDWDLYARFFLRSKCRHIDKLLYLYRFKDNWANTTFTRNKSIQDHLALGRANYAAEFEKFNEKRLSASKPQQEPLVFSKAYVPGMISIVLPTRGRPANVRRLVDSALATCHEAPKVEFCFYADDDDQETISVLKEMKLRHKVGPRIPLSQAFNEAARISSGEIIHCSADDIVYRTSGWDSLIRKEFEKIPDRIALVFGRDGHEDGKIPTHPFLHRRWVETVGYLLPPYFSGWYSDNWLEDMAIRIDRKVYVPEVFTEHLHFSAGKAEKDATYLESAMRSARETGLMKDLESVRIADAAKLRKAIESEVRWTLRDVSFVVLEASRTPLTVRCLTSIRKHAPEAEIVMVDNGTGSEIVHGADKTVHLEANLGFAAGCNAGAAAATRDVLCFMNNDAEFVDALTPMLLVERMTETHPITAPFSNRAKPPQGDIERRDAPSIDVLTDMVVGLCMMVPKALYKALGGFDPRLLTYEDDDFCLRARRLGKGSKIVGGTWVNHERHATFKALGLDPQAVMARNSMIFKRKNPTVRVVVIAKDEERSIEAFFRQFERITRDWCVLDTGSSDRTVEVAKSIGARVETAPFEDFASARNKALEKFGEGADWFIMFDPDERLDAHTISHLPEFIFNTDADIVLAPLQALNPDGSKKDFVPKPFLFRNTPEIRWIFKVHEKLVGSSRQVLLRNAMITHVMELHEDGRRQRASGLYDDLMRREPYFTSERYKKDMRAKWPILDYDVMDDERIRKECIGPLVSVVIPTYKRAKLLERAIASVFKQDYRNWEIVIVGDACPELDAAFHGSHSKNRVFNLKTNHGAGGAVPRNHAIAAAAGSLIAYLDDDNQWKPDHLSSLYEAMRSSGAAFAFSSMEVDGKDRGFTEPKLQGIDTSCVLHRKNLVEKYGPWKDRIEGGYAHDWEFISRWVKGGEKWICTRKPTLIYNAETSGQADFLKATAK